jgi:hypothetical protein
MPQTVSPVFILSLPRSGSTLLQKILASHADVATVSEPWILLPPVYALRSDRSSAEYSQTTLSAAVNDFIDCLPNGRADYFAALREFAASLYTRLAPNGERFFLDKTPRYHLIIRELMEIFPDAKFILLWRNPLAVAASMIETWGYKGRWNLFRYRIDLYQGLENLVTAATDFKDRIHRLNYEEMVSNPEAALGSVCEYLGLRLDAAALEHFERDGLSGRLGDPTGPKKYDSISTDSIDSWGNVLNNPLRRWWARRYIEWIGRDRLRAMGYDQHELLTQITALNGFAVQQTLSDFMLMPLGAAHTNLGLSETKRQLKAWRAGKRRYPAN